MYLTKELFVILDEKDYILYAPLKGKALSVNGGTINLLKKVSSGEELPRAGVLEELVNEGIVVEQEEPEPVFDSDADKPFKPTSVTLFPTTNCNLRCIYCYSSAGENPVNMEWEVAKAAIDFVVENALDLGKRDIAVNFHGGGEPFHHTVQKLVKRVISYGREEAKKNKLELIVNGSTNGLLGQPMREWITQNLTSIQVSIDGPKEIQNNQRPSLRNNSSFEGVMETIRYFERQKYRYSVRSTITSKSVERMLDLISFFSAETALRELHLEPVTETGRCHTSSTYAPSPELFLTKMIDAKEVAKKLGIKIYYSSGKLDRLSSRYCGAAGKNFVVASTGIISSCYEVTDYSDQRAKEFIYGRYNPQTKSFGFISEVIKRQATRTVHKMGYCSDCFAKYNCGGDCLAKIAALGDMFDPSNNPRCIINRGLVLYELKCKLEGR